MVSASGSNRTNASTPVSPWQVGLVVGTTMAALSLRPSGIQRGPVAQSILTGASFALGMGVGIGLNKGVKAVASATDTDESTVRAIALGLGVTAMAAGKLGRSRPFPFSNTIDSLGRAATACAVGGFAVVAHNAAADAVADHTDGTPHVVVSTAMAGVEAAVLIGYLAWRRRVNAAVDPTTPTLKAVAAAAGTIAGATALVGTEQTLTERTGRRTGTPKWLLHAGAAIGGTALAGAGYMLYRKLRAAGPPPPSLTTTLTTVAGHPGSVVDVAKLPPAAIQYLNSTVPGHEITRVMGEPAIDPIRTIVGLESAATPEARADLALASLRQLGAFGNDTRGPVRYVFVTVPPGAGKIDTPLMASAEYMARGDVASVAIQYSNRPSALSLGRVDDGALAYGRLFERLHDEILRLPEDQRPKVLVYGNSLGAWVSQETAGGMGIAGMPAIDRALWVGTPGPSGWYRQMMYSKDPRFATDRLQVHQFSSVEELRRFAATKEAGDVRFFLHTRHSDPVPKVDVDMLWRRPLWLRDEYRSISGAPRHEVYSPGVTFLQELTDTAITASIADNPEKATIGHTYHTDIVTDVRHALFPGSITDGQEAAIHSVLDGTPPVNVVGGGR